MKKRFLSSLAIVVAMSVGSFATGQDYYDLEDTSAAPVSYLGGGCDAVGCDKGCDDCGKGCDIGYECCDSGHVYGLAEWTWFAYHRADGSRVGDDATNDDAQADFHSSMRYTAGYIGCSGLGIRTRYWRFGHSNNTVAAQNAAGGVEDPQAGGGAFMVDPAEGIYTSTYNFDIEVFETVELNCDWTLEISGGFRYNDFEETLLDREGTNLFVRHNASDSFGGIVGLEAKRLLNVGSLYIGARTSILMANDARRFITQVGQAPSHNELLQDVPRQQIEIFGGWEYDRCLDSGSIFFLRAGVEWQHWMNFSSAFLGPDNVGAPVANLFDGEDFFGGESNVGFGGITVGAGLLF